MDLTLTKRGDYAVRAALALAKAYGDGQYRKIREVAEEMSLPLRYTPQILNLLLKAGLAEARAGQQGGYRLLRSPAQISLLEIVEAAEGPLRPERCTLSGGPCHWETMCPLHTTWEAATHVFSEVLRNRTLASAAEIDAKLESNEIDVPTDAHGLVSRRRPS